MTLFLQAIGAIVVTVGTVCALIAAWAWHKGQENLVTPRQAVIAFAVLVIVAAILAYSTHANDVRNRQCIMHYGLDYCSQGEGGTPLDPTP